MKMRWFHTLLSLFPASTRDRQLEMVDALAESDPSWRNVARESGSLLWACAMSWSRYLRASEGLWRSAYVGAVLWFGALLAIGPLLRLKFTLQLGASVPGSQTGPLPYVIALALCIFAVVVMSRSRWTAAALGGVGIYVAARSNVIEPWGTIDSAWYEARWLGAALFLVVCIAGRATTQRSLPPWLPLAAVMGFATAVLALPLDSYASRASRNYGIMLQWNLWPSFQEHFARGIWEWVVSAIVIAALLAVFLHPIPSAFAAAPIVHLVGVSMHLGLTLALIAGVALTWRPLLARIHVQVKWKQSSSDL